MRRAKRNIHKSISVDKHLKYKCPICRAKEDNTASSRKYSYNKEDSDKSLIGNKRKSEGEVNGKRRIKKRKEFDECGSGYGYTNGSSSNKGEDKDKLSDDIEELRKVTSKR